MKLEKYVFDEKTKAILESSCVPFAIFQFLDDRVVTHLLTDGFLDIVGVDRKTAHDRMDNHLYDNDHPDDVRHSIRQSQTHRPSATTLTTSTRLQPTKHFRMLLQRRKQLTETSMTMTQALIRV